MQGSTFNNATGLSTRLRSIQRYSNSLEATSRKSQVFKKLLDRIESIANEEEKESTVREFYDRKVASYTGAVRNIEGKLSQTRVELYRLRDEITHFIRSNKFTSRLWNGDPVSTKCIAELVQRIQDMGNTECESICGTLLEFASKLRCLETEEVSKSETLSKKSNKLHEWCEIQQYSLEDSILRIREMAEKYKSEHSKYSEYFLAELQEALDSLKDPAVAGACISLSDFNEQLAQLPPALQAQIREAIDNTLNSPEATVGVLPQRANPSEERVPDEIPEHAEAAAETYDPRRDANQPRSSWVAAVTCDSGMDAHHQGERRRS